MRQMPTLHTVAQGRCAKDEVVPIAPTNIKTDGGSVPVHFAAHNQSWLYALVVERSLGLGNEATIATFRSRDPGDRWEKVVGKDVPTWVKKWGQANSAMIQVLVADPTAELGKY